MSWNDKNLISKLVEGQVAVMPTDTIYGIVGKAESEATVRRIYEIKKREPEKPCIILISDPSDLEKFSINISSEQKEKLQEFWPGPVSAIFDCAGDRFSYLHRGTYTLAFRLPNSAELRAMLKTTGPLIAPSANPEGLSPAKNIEEARNYFGDNIDIYAQGGEMEGSPSRVIRLYKDGRVAVIRN